MLKEEKKYRRKESEQGGFGIDILAWGSFCF